MSIRLHIRPCISKYTRFWCPIWTHTNIFPHFTAHIPSHWIKYPKILSNSDILRQIESTESDMCVWVCGVCEYVLCLVYVMIRIPNGIEFKPNAINDFYTNIHFRRIHPVRPRMLSCHSENFNLDWIILGLVHFNYFSLRK